MALAEVAAGKDYVDIPLTYISFTSISWYHHISMLPKVKSDAERAFYILKTTCDPEMTEEEKKLRQERNILAIC